MASRNQILTYALNHLKESVEDLLCDYWADDLIDIFELDAIKYNPDTPQGYDALIEQVNARIDKEIEDTVGL